MNKYYVPVLSMILILMATLYCAEGQRIEKKVIVTSAKKAALGVVIKDLEESEKSELKVESGALIEEVLEDSEAESVGLKKDDVVIRFDGKKVETAAQLKDLVAELEDEKTVKLEVIREGNARSFDVKLKPVDPEEIKVSIDENDFDFEFGNGEGMFLRHGGPGHPDFTWFEEQGKKGGFLGVRAKNISEQLKNYFEVSNGVLVEEVVKESPAEKAGLQAGDVIMMIEDRKIEDYRDLIRTLNYYNPEEKVKIQVMRKGSEKKIDVVLGEPKNERLTVFKKGAPEMLRKAPPLRHRIKREIMPEKEIIRKKIRRAGEKLEDLKDLKIDIELYII